MVQIACLLFGMVWMGDGAKLTYEAAYTKANKENKPLVILVGAEWCSACKTMKATTIDRMTESGELKDVVFIHLDKDEHPELAERIMVGESLPQLIVFAKNEEGWKRFSATGIQTENRVKELIRRAAGGSTTELRLVR